MFDVLRHLNTSEIPEVVDRYRDLAALFPLDFRDLDKIRQALDLLVQLLEEAVDVTRTEVDDEIVAVISGIAPEVLQIIDSVSAIVRQLRESFSVEKQEALGLTTAALLEPPAESNG